jgi:hypothetical protein
MLFLPKRNHPNQLMIAANLHHCYFCQQVMARPVYDYYCQKCDTYKALFTVNSSLYFFEKKYRNKIYRFLFLIEENEFRIVNDDIGTIYKSQELPTITPDNALQKLPTILTFL